MNEAGVHAKVSFFLVEVMEDNKLSTFSTRLCNLRLSCRVGCQEALGSSPHLLMHWVVEEHMLFLRRGTSKQCLLYQVGLSKEASGRKGLKKTSSVSDAKTAFSTFS